MIKIYDDKLAEEICARMDEEILALDAHIAELLNYGKLPEIVDSMQARRETAERVKRNICRVNEEAHRIDAEAAAELRKETEKLRAFSRKLDDINAMLVSVMKTEAVNLSNDSGVSAEKMDMLNKLHADLVLIEKENVKKYAIKHLVELGILEGNPIYEKSMAELDKAFEIEFRYALKANIQSLNLKANPYADMRMNEIYDRITMSAIAYGYAGCNAMEKKEVDIWLTSKLKTDRKSVIEVHNAIGILYTELLEVMGEMQYEAGGIKCWNLTEEECNDAHKAMLKYGIIEREEVALFLSNAIVETITIGDKQEEWEKYVEGSKESEPYLGGGALQLTHDYNYKNYAIALLLKDYPGISEVGVRATDGRSNNYVFYDVIFSDNQESDIKIPGLESEEALKKRDEYKKIVDEGKVYVAQNYAWDSAGWLWSEEKKVAQRLINDSNITPLHFGIDRKVEISTFAVNGGYTLLEERNSAYQSTNEWRNKTFVE